jgi:hypothetical protein
MARATQPVSRPTALPRAITLGEDVTASETADTLTSDSPSTGEIRLSWSALPHAESYFVLRSNQPTFELAWSPVIHDQCETNSYSDVEVAPDTSYYYAIVATMGDGTLMLVATGRAATLAEDTPLVGEPAAKARKWGTSKGDVAVSNPTEADAAPPRADDILRAIEVDIPAPRS